MAVSALLFAKKKGIDLSTVGIAVDFLQVLSILTSFGFKWPMILSNVFASASSVSFNEQLVAPECSIGTVPFDKKCVRTASRCVGLSPCTC